MKTNELKDLILNELHEMKALDIKILNVTNLTSMTDYMIICTGNSSRHVKAIGRHLYDKIKAAGTRPIGMEGESDAEWVLIDFGDAIVHVMQAKSRAFYQLENLWSSDED